MNAAADADRPTPARKKQRTASLPVDLIERVQAAVYWLRVIPGEPATFSEFVEKALRHDLQRVERDYNEGEPFEMPEGESLRPGPAPGVMKKVAALRRAARELEQERRSGGADNGAAGDDAGSHAGGRADQPRSSSGQEGDRGPDGIGEVGGESGSADADGDPDEGRGAS